MKKLITLILLFAILVQCRVDEGLPAVTIEKGDHLVLIGNNLCSRMMNYGYFETAMQQSLTDSLVSIRNMCDGGDTPSYRPHSSRDIPWAFPGAEKFRPQYKNVTGGVGFFPTPDEWLTKAKADVIVAFFGYNASFADSSGLDLFEQEIQAFIDHTNSQKYNGDQAAKLVMVSPIAVEDVTEVKDVPDGEEANRRLEMYTNVIERILLQNDVPFLDAFSASKKWYENKGSNNDFLTIDGVQLNDQGNELFADWLTTKLIGKKLFEGKNKNNKERIKAAVLEKNWVWHNDYKIPNGVHAYGRRYDPFGPDNYPFEKKKLEQMTAIRDSAIWLAAKREELDILALDKSTIELPPVETNFEPEDKSSLQYAGGTDMIRQMSLPPGYEVNCFASEDDFPDLANPVQMSFDNKGRLWVAVMPSYPHYRPGDQKPNDKILIFEDNDNDGKADRQITYAEGLHLPIGFEIASEGVYVSQGTNLVLLRDTDGDDMADEQEILLSGFDDHDTHHAISAFCADPSGAIAMCEGVFLHTNVETPYGVMRAANGGFFRYNPARHHLERVANLSIPNPWGVAFDEWGQQFFIETSGPAMHWMAPSTARYSYGVPNHKPAQLIEPDYRVRPTAGLEFVSSRHFPDEVQGDFLLCNSIGFLGIRQHKLVDDSTGFKSTFRHDLMSCSNPNFRPVDLEFAPDGSLYFVDWQNVLIGHMQHNARDPLRDHGHGRVYRITYPSRPLVVPPQIDDASIETLLSHLKLPEYRTRYRVRRELRGRDAEKVNSALDKWVEELDKNDEKYAHHLTEAMWVSWGSNQISESLVEKVLQSDSFHARAAGVKAIRYMGHQLENGISLLQNAAKDPHGRVRMEAITAASTLEPEIGLPILLVAQQSGLDEWITPVLENALAHIQGEVVADKKEAVETKLTGAARDKFIHGLEIYNRESHCGTCHQPNGRGIPVIGYPPLSNTEWVLGDEERLIKLTLNGLFGPMEVNGVKYQGNVPMTAFGGLLNDEEVAAVLTYVRNAFGNEASEISSAKVASVRASIADKKGYFRPEELEVGKTDL